MKAIVQRVKKADVTVDQKIVGSINRGLLVFLGVEQDDDEQDVDRLAKRIINLRIFPDQGKESNISIIDCVGELLVVSQFTLCADTHNGRRPSYEQAALPDRAEKLYQFFCQKLKDYSQLKVAQGEFGAMMEVTSINDGPATFILEEN